MEIPSHLVEAPLHRFSLQQTSVADFLQWDRQKELVLNATFQRRALWSADARSYLIDTILLGFSMPKIYLRTTIDAKTQRSIRDVVDGQQRLHAIIDFAADKLTLNRRSRKFEGMRYSDLSEDLKQAFLGYIISVEHLVNANDQVVLEMFARLNTYTVTLNPAEIRHATYDTELKWFVFWLSNDLRWFLEEFHIVSIRTMVRMDDDVFFAELVNLLGNGLGDGGAAALNILYRTHQDAFPPDPNFRDIITEAVQWMTEDLAPILANTPLGRTYQVQMLFAAYVHHQHGLPAGRLGDELPPRSHLAPVDEILERLNELAEAVDYEGDEGPHRAFVEASSGATTRYKSRRVRFLTFVDAFAGG